LRIMAKPRPVQGLAKHYRMFIDGEWVDSKREETIDVVNPATERVIASVPSRRRMHFRRRRTLNRSGKISRPSEGRRFYSRRLN